MDIYSLTAKKLLAISVPEKLFTRDGLKKEWQKLSSKWHPDKNEAVDHGVLSHINMLYNQALDKVAKDLWVIPGQLDLSSKDGRKFQIHYKKHRELELGDMYISDTVVAYIIKPGNSDLVASAKKITSSFSYDGDDMKKEYAKYLPETIVSTQLIDGSELIVYKKTADVFCLRDVLEHYGTIDPKHVAWIMSRLYNLSCYLKWAGVAHNHISPDTIFISAKFHSALLLGGWWYSTIIGEKMVALPKRTIENISPALIKAKVGTVKVDSELIKATGRELLGDIHGMKLLTDKSIPKAFLMWLRTPANGKPVADYKLWYNKILPDSFGPRKFVKMELSSKEVYDA